MSTPILTPYGVIIFLMSIAFVFGMITYRQIHIIISNHFDRTHGISRGEIR